MFSFNLGCKDCSPFKVSYRRAIETSRPVAEMLALAPLSISSTGNDKEDLFHILTY